MQEIKELPVLDASDPNCRPCPVGKALGQRRCPGVRIRGVFVRLFRGIWRRFSRKR